MSKFKTELAFNTLEEEEFEYTFADMAVGSFFMYQGRVWQKVRGCINEYAVRHSLGIIENIADSTFVEPIEKVVLKVREK